MQPGTRFTFIIEGVEFVFRFCPPGAFTMGSPESEKGRDEDEITLEVNIDVGFFICETPITQEQWDALGVEKEHKCLHKGAKLPVASVSWKESRIFCDRLNDLGIVPTQWRFDLPTEEQWEYACRAGTYGATYGKPLNKSAWYKANSRNKPHRVGLKAPNNWGIYDMLGNVWEWTSSLYDDSIWHIFRGGSWGHSAEYCRPAMRGYVEPSGYANNLGVRVILVGR